MRGRKRRSPVLRLCLAVIRAASRLVPAPLRGAWRQEWEAEVLHRWSWLEERRLLSAANRAALVRRVLGALPDAAWARRQLTTDADLVHDLRHGLRRLRREATFAALAVGILALGIGSANSVFAVVDALLLRPLPYRDAERVVTLWQTNPKDPASREEVAPANFLDWRERARSFEAIAAADPYSYDYTGGAEPEVLFAVRVTEGFFEALGVAPLHGRLFLAEEYQPGRERVVLLTHGLWRRLGADPALVGRTLSLEYQPYTIVGVLPAEFDPGLLPTAGARDLWTPHVVEDHERLTRGSAWWAALARLRPGVTLGQAQAELDAIAGELAREHPRTNAGTGIEAVPLREHLAAGVRPALRLLLVAVGLLLLITWANVASLLLARGARRQREMAICASLGAGRGRLARQLLAEAALLACLGCALGLLLAHWGVAVIVGLSPVDVPRLDQAGVDGRVAAFAVALSFVATLACGVVPALRFSRPRLEAALKDAGRGTPGRGRQRLRRGLVMGEVALALVLLAGAGLLGRSFTRLLREDPGFRSPGVLALQVFAWDRNPTPEAIARFFDETLDRLRALPGVQGAGAVSRMPFIEANINIRSPFAVEGRPPVEHGQERSVYLSLATPEYFGVMGIPLLQGRLFARDDGPGRTPVALVNETLARAEWGDESPVGRRVSLRWHGRPVQAQVVGVVGAVRHERLDRPAEPEAFIPFAQLPYASMTYVLRAAVAPASLVDAAKRRVWSVDPRQAFYRVATTDELLAKSVADRRFVLLLLLAFAGAALVLQATGLYGLLSYLAAERTREIGVRLALGAEGRDILRLVITQGLMLVLGGLGLGLGVAFFVAGVLRGLLYGVAPADPITLAGVSALLALVALGACYLPARRATRVDPIAALRAE